MIRVLDSFLINQIAAGEVIERPSSVVKELVENSIDANSTSIVVEAKEGGLSYIRVTDNGEGMNESDSTLSFERHATSKIASSKDLERIISLGFRGEALASIASVSQVEMFSCFKEAELGIHILNHGGDIILKKGYGCPKGTSVIVRNLFYNVPARLKFVKTTRSEAASIADLMSKLILSCPHISFRYIYDEKTIYSSPGDGNLLSAVAGVYGAPIANEIIKIEKDEKNGFALIGYIGKASIARKNRNQQTFFVNGRFVKNYMLSSCVSEAYKSHLPTNHFAWVALYLKINPELVDVNVHPAKTQVRFKDERQVYITVLKCIREALESDNSFSKRVVDPIFLNSTRNISGRGSSAFLDFPMFNGSKTNDDKIYTQMKVDGFEPEKIKEQITPMEIHQQNIRLIGSAFNTYVIAQREHDIILIDQHAAHERMLYEQYKDEIAFKKIHIQLLLTPLIIELEEKDKSFINELILAMRSAGFDIENFDSRSVVVRGIPSVLTSIDVKDFFRNAINDSNENMYSDNDSSLERIIKLTCKKAVKANKPLSEIEMLYILDSIIQNRIPATCPHGRPILIILTKNELESRFKRR